jgi:hypothetical protein
MQLNRMLNDALATANKEMAAAEAQAGMWHDVIQAIRAAKDCINPERAGQSAGMALDAEQCALNGDRLGAELNASRAIITGWNL